MKSVCGGENLLTCTLVHVKKNRFARNSKIRNKDYDIIIKKNNLWIQARVSNVWFNVQVVAMVYLTKINLEEYAKQNKVSLSSPPHTTPFIQTNLICDSILPDFMIIFLDGEDDGSTVLSRFLRRVKQFFMNQ